MNRLHIRLSVAFISVILLVSLGPLIFQLILIWLEIDRPPEILNELPELSVLSDDVWEKLQTLTIKVLSIAILQTTFWSAVVGIIAGVLISRSLAAPLQRLKKAAEMIGEQDLGFRVEVSGTEEVQAVAEAFNEMATKLEAAESQRRNLLADVAHELRTPITVIQGNLRAILDDIYPLEKEEIARLYDQTRLLTRLVNDLHELAQAEAHQLPLNKQDVDVAKLVQDAAAFYRTPAEGQGVTLRVELLGKLPHVTGDQARLGQVLHNLLSNALRHTPAGGLVLIQVEQVGHEVHIRLRDTGEGIAAEHLPYVFDRFYRTDPGRGREQGGSGLGLALVRAIVEGHNGRVQVHSAGVGQGTQFTLYLPSS